MISLPQVQQLKAKFFRPSLDILAILAWAGLLLHFWLSGQLNLLIHPNYFLLVLGTSLVLFVLGIAKIWYFLRELRGHTSPNENLQHISILPNGVGSAILLITAIAGLIFPPTALTSQMALQRGVTEALPVTRTETQSFRATTNPEERSLIDWIRTLNAYPEPDAYAGQKANVTGFVVHLPGLEDNYFLISRFILTCCAVDAYPIGLPVKIEGSNQDYPPDTWLEIEGEMMTQTLPLDSQTMRVIDAQKRQLVLVANSLKKIPTPKDPYSYAQ